MKEYIWKSICLNELNFDDMKEHVICESDSIFYTPTTIPEQCITTALNCVMEELNGTVRHECTDKQGYINRTLDFLNTIITKRKTGHALIDSTECDCHKWPQTPLAMFLNETRTLLQLHCTEVKRDLQRLHQGTSQEA
ncbi:hypothetical protein L3Q82_005635 [Scortum barcoo]|uniref:Uncharacterized protein n=1 Tax=Scortum barcoo TaxID=214431 RepID=A0ACB8V966_9TELE|nr:hypothetical protein L3Q82_005635 [Scortum barcoo]